MYRGRRRAIGNGPRIRSSGSTSECPSGEPASSRVSERCFLTGGRAKQKSHEFGCWKGEINGPDPAFAWNPAVPQPPTHQRPVRRVKRTTVQASSKLMPVIVPDAVRDGNLCRGTERICFGCRGSPRCPGCLSTGLRFGRVGFHRPLWSRRSLADMLFCGDRWLAGSRCVRLPAT